VSKVGADAVSPLLECIRTTDDADKLRAAVRVIERVGGRGKLDRNLVAARLTQLTHRR
jgi:hypothetical protein